MTFSIFMKLLILSNFWREPNKLIKEKFCFLVQRRQAYLF